MQKHVLHCNKLVDMWRQTSEINKEFKWTEKVVDIVEK